MCNIDTPYKRIIYIIKQINMTQKAFLLSCGLSKGVLSELKAGRAQNLRTDTLNKIADKLTECLGKKITVDYILNGIEKTPDNSGVDDINMIKLWNDYNSLSPADKEYFDGLLKRFQGH